MTTRSNDHPDGLILVLQDQPLAVRQRRLVDAAAGYATKSKASNTRRVYQGAQERFLIWCEEIGLQPYTDPYTGPRTTPYIKPGVVALYLTALAESGKAWGTLSVALSALEAQQHLAGGPALRDAPEVAEVCAGIRRTIGTASMRQAKPLSVEQLRATVEALDGPAALRDRALLLLGFSGAFRRSELVALDHGDLTRETNGFIVQLQRSKTDQEGQGYEKGIPFGGRASTCPVRALDAWMEDRGDETPGEPLFVRYSRCCPQGTRLSDQTVNTLVQDRMREAGLDPRGYSGHSLRAGFVTAAAKAGKRIDQIMRQTGHKSSEMVLRYIRHEQLFEENPAEGLGL